MRVRMEFDGGISGSEHSFLGEVRMEVAQFAILMERELRKNNHKRGWKHMTPGALMRSVARETIELRREVVRPRRQHMPTQIGEEAADVANFCMMVADVCGALK